MIRRAVALVGLVAGLALSGCASDDWQGRYDEAQGEILDLADERNEARAQVADTMADLEAERARNAQLGREASEAIQREQEALRRAQEYKDALAAASTRPAEPVVTVDTQVQRLVSEGWDAYRTPDGDVAIRLASDVTFGSGKHALTSTGLATLRKIAPKLTSGDFARYDIRVEGHTDNEPLKKTKTTYGDNRGLGSARANSVTQFLESEFGIDPARIDAVSKGEHEPIADNSTKAGRAKNRRVEIILVLPQEQVDQAAAK